MDSLTGSLKFKIAGRGVYEVRFVDTADVHAYVIGPDGEAVMRSSRSNPVGIDWLHAFCTGHAIGAGYTSDD